MQSDTHYTCSLCKGVFEKAWSDEEAIKEREELYPDVKEKDFAIICDFCFQKFQIWEKANAD